jgi:hypothetical protein
MNWTHLESYSADCGLVQKVLGNGWITRVNLEGTFYRVAETYECAEIAMKECERIWKRERQKRGIR